MKDVVWNSLLLDANKNSLQLCHSTINFSFYSQTIWLDCVSFDISAWRCFIVVFVVHNCQRFGEFTERKCFFFSRLYWYIFAICYQFVGSMSCCSSVTWRCVVCMCLIDSFIIVVELKFTCFNKLILSCSLCWFDI